MKRDIVMVGEVPNYPLLAEIVKEAHNEYLGFSLTPSKVAEVSYFINNRVKHLIDTRQWQTSFITAEGRIANFKRIKVLQDAVNPNDLRVIPIWEYMEER